MMLYVCYKEYGFGDGCSRPIAVFDSLEKTENWMNKNGIDATYEVIKLNEENE